MHWNLASSLGSTNWMVFELWILGQARCSAFGKGVYVLTPGSFCKVKWVPSPIPKPWGWIDITHSLDQNISCDNPNLQLISSLLTSLAIPCLIFWAGQSFRAFLNSHGHKLSPVPTVSFRCRTVVWFQKEQSKKVSIISVASLGYRTLVADCLTLWYVIVG